MITVERTVTVGRPVAAVFAYLADFTHTEQWDPGTVTTTRIGTGALGVGSRFHNVSKFRGRKTELEYETKRFDEGERLVFTGVNKTVEATDDMTFRATGEGTSITYQARFVFNGLARFAEPLLRKSFDSIADDTVAQLKTTLETAL